MVRQILPAVWIATVLLIHAWAGTTLAGPVGIPEEMLEEIRADAGDRVIYEDDQGIMLLDTKFDPRKIYDPPPESVRGPLQENIYRDLMTFMEDGQKVMAGVLLLIKSGSFLWPGHLRFQATIWKKGVAIATAPMTSARYALVGSEQSLTWFELGNGESKTLLPREDRLVPPQLQGMPSVYRIYVLFPGTIEVEGEYRSWNPLNLKETTIAPVPLGQE